MLMAVSSVAITNAQAQTVTEEDMLQNKAIREYLTTNTEAGKYYRESFYDLPTEIQDKILTNANITRDELIRPTSGISAYFTTDDENTDSGTSEIVLLSQKMKTSSYTKNIIGQVKNIGNSSAEYIEIGATAYNKNGEIIGTGSGYTNADTLKPGQKSTFEVSLWKDDFKGMKSYELSLEWQDVGDFGNSQYVENAQIYKDNSTITKQS
jgi:hypothetical protein